MHNKSTLQTPQRINICTATEINKFPLSKLTKIKVYVPGIELNFVLSCKSLIETEAFVGKSKFFACACGLG